MTSLAYALDVWGFVDKPFCDAHGRTGRQWVCGTLAGVIRIHSETLAADLSGGRVYVSLWPDHQGAVDPLDRRMYLTADAALKALPGLFDDWLDGHPTEEGSL